MPGSEVVTKGVEDLTAGRWTSEALLVSMALTRLRALGVPIASAGLDEPEIALYRLLGARDPANAYRDYNSLRRRLDSFCRALEHRVMSARRLAAGGRGP